VKRLGWLVLVAAVALGCEREMRRFDSTPTSREPSVAAPRVDVQPGEGAKGLTETKSAGGYSHRNAYEIAQGKRLFRWFNCNGCHSAGGGGMGPPLMDESWIYGHQPEAIFSTIMEGRPNGMPAFRGRIPEQQAWQLVSYVRSMSGLVADDALPGRSDTLSPGEPELRRDSLEPKMRRGTP
jgi:cytochrome c oxidase cbb3-type subunit 3